MARTTKSDQIEDAVEAPAEDVIVNTEQATEASAEALTGEAAAEGQAQPSTSGEAPASPEPGSVAMAPTITVTCLSKGGRRRAGRNWPEGPTIVSADALTPYHLDQLRGDPRFRVGSDTDLPCEGC